MNAINRAGVEALIAARTQLGDDDDVDVVIEDGPQRKGAGSQTRVAVDAHVHVNHVRSVLPDWVSLSRLETKLAPALRAIPISHGATVTHGYRLGMPDHHHFLTDGWIEAAKALQAEFAERIPPSPIQVRVNVVITESPHHDGNILGRIDSTAGGETMIEIGHLDDPELTVTVDYATALAAFVTRDPQAVMQAMFGGKILIEGDASQLLLLQAQAPSADAVEMYERLDAITAR